MVSLKSPPPIGQAVFEKTIGNPFLTFFNTDRNAPKIFQNSNMGIIISNLLLESIFDFPKSKIDSKSRFDMRMAILVFKIFFGVFWSLFKKVKKWIFHCIFKYGSANRRGLFQRYHIGYLEFLVHFYIINTAWLLKMSYFDFDPPIYHPTISEVH